MNWDPRIKTVASGCYVPMLHVPVSLLGLLSNCGSVVIMWIATAAWYTSQAQLCSYEVIQKGSAGGSE